ncbi:alpha/beta hydrolase [Croceicoccus sp. BE223]|uniref:alpha/beta fold hydrolase n=1 Tax=Croceicoccus sp. BE223 TaxID=2817716 RepID=UPI0028588C86|nr:alpha/beta hydrolase [Croceicoccus sp. BE223]MDR7103118.1 pimeloyl-ACP methyl ester carboxylesterase [Croceicoccus sp. BE223]
MTMIDTRDGTRLYAKEWGPRHGRPVVLIHGWPLSADSWDPQMNALADAGYRVVAYDRRGFGRSDQPGSGNDYDTYADDLADVMAAKQLQADVALVGFSMGGGEIARYMSRHGGKSVSRAVFVSSVAGYLLKGPDNPDGVPQATFDDMTAAMKKDHRKFFTGFFKDFYGVGMLSHPVSDEQLHWAWRTAMQAGLRNILQAAEAFATTDFRPDLDHVKVPSLVIHGTADKTVPIEATGHVVAKKVPGARLIEYDGEPHAVFATQQDRLTQDLLDFLGEGVGASNAREEKAEPA